MTVRKYKWLTGLIGVACIACCAIPVGLLFTASGTLAITTLLASNQMKEVLICSVPLLAIMMGYFIITRRRKKAASCCNDSSGCEPNQCNIDSSKR